LVKKSSGQKKYSSKSALFNELIRQARNQQLQMDWIKTKLEKAEKSEFSNDSKEQILAQSKS
jgi:antitoxin ParD1/3/4